MAFTGRQAAVSKRLRGAKGVALVVSLPLSALLTAVALQPPQQPWLAWICLLPLFAAIRWLPWPAAATAGGLWGACLYLCCVAIPAPVITSSLLSLVLLTAAAAVYTGLGALLVRAIGFSAAVLGACWIVVEIGLRPLGLQHGLLAGTQGDNTHLDRMSHLFGYVTVACLLAGINALLVSALGYVRVGGVGLRSVGGWGDPGKSLAPPVVPDVLLFAIGPHRPRGPPTRFLEA